MLCVLGTVNLGRTVYQKVQLQAAADAAAYSQAAVEARVMNFTAYTNRAMVVHYASIMAATSYLTWLHFIWAGLKPLLEVLGHLPYIGPIASALENGLGALVRILDAGIAALCPMARHFRWGFSIGIASLHLGSIGRTEMGAYAPRTGLERTQTAPPQVWSGQRLRLVAKAFGFTKRLNVLSLVEMDQLYAPFPKSEHQYYLLFSAPRWLRRILPGIGHVRDAMSEALQRYAPSPGRLEGDAQLFHSALGCPAHARARVQRGRAHRAHRRARTAADPAPLTCFGCTPRIRAAR